jgi:hypothetical protein
MERHKMPRSLTGIADVLRGFIDEVPGAVNHGLRPQLHPPSADVIVVERPIVDRRIDVLQQVIHVLLSEPWEGPVHPLGELLVHFNPGIEEEGALKHIVSGQDIDRLVEASALQEAQTSLLDVLSIRNRTVDVCGRRGRADVGEVALNDRLRVELSGFVQVLYVEKTHEIVEDALRLIELGNDARALRDGLGKRLRSIGSHMQQDRAARRRLAHDCNVVFGTPEEVDVLLDPFQSETLIQNTGVESTVAFDFGAGEEAESAEAVVEADKDEVFTGCLAGLGNDTRWVEVGRAGAILGAERVTAAMNLASISSALGRFFRTSTYPNQDGSVGTTRSSLVENLLRHMDVEEKAVLRGVGIDISRQGRRVQQVLLPLFNSEGDVGVRVFRDGDVGVRLPLRPGLGADLGLLADLDDAPIGLRGDWGPETEITFRPLGVADVPEFVDVGLFVVPDRPMQFL